MALPVSSDKDMGKDERLAGWYNKVIKPNETAGCETEHEDVGRFFVQQPMQGSPLFRRLITVFG